MENETLEIINIVAESGSIVIGGYILLLILKEIFHFMAKKNGYDSDGSEMEEIKRHVNKVENNDIRHIEEKLSYIDDCLKENTKRIRSVEEKLIKLDIQTLQNQNDIEEIIDKD